MALNKYLSLAWFLALATCACSSGSEDGEPLEPPEPPGQPFGLVKGADVSWLSEMEAAKIKFYNNVGEEKDLLEILKGKGMNTIRLRVWVNPQDGWCDVNDVVEKARRAKRAGFRTLIDFHYSDSWADPGKQTKPALWQNKDISALKALVSSHTTEVLAALKNHGVTPEWVQIGNETNNGMLWEDGKASVSMKSFAELILSGYNAVKATSPDIKVIVHLSNGYDNSMFRWMFDGLKANGAKWDVVGMSLYPRASDWQQKNEQCLANMQDMITRYDKEVLLCEVGMPMSEGAAAKAFITDLIAKVKSLPENKGLGVLYWEPQAYNSWKGYKLGAFDDSGKPTEALDAFIN
ncbi:arabinogalactan endo-beta-1,4-galactanase [Arcticibacter sp.]|uniref:glycoside hydrolase family 53 protein n=1 Tax=Arcticibacter sp. TaxID=1872630 RepID=UPI00388FA4EA